MRHLDWQRVLSGRGKLALASAAALVVVALLSSPFWPAGRSGAPVRYVTIPATRDLYRIGVTLEQRRVVRSRFAFAVLARLRGAQGRIQGGTYALSPGENGWQIVTRLMEGHGQVTRLTIPEGYSLAKIAQLLDAKGIAEGDAFLALARAPRRFVGRHAWLRDLPAGATLEGFLFPDTFLFEAGPVQEGVLIDRMLERFETVLRAEYRRAQKPPRSLFETVTLASLIELEAVRPEERPLISGVFQNRLKLGMRLGSDPTVEYALGQHQDRKGLSLKDIRIDSPYNTYRYAGLPPGPIANPGLASFEAALYPEGTDFLYFVARGDGTHAFTRTYADHLAAQRHLRR